MDINGYAVLPRKRLEITCILYALVSLDAGVIFFLRDD